MTFLPAFGLFAMLQGAVPADAAPCRGHGEQLAAHAELLERRVHVAPGMPLTEVIACLGAPDRRADAEPPEDWYDTMLIYDLLTRPQAPQPPSRSTPWRIEVLLLDGVVVHVRTIGWLE